MKGGRRFMITIEELRDKTRMEAEELRIKKTSESKKEIVPVFLSEEKKELFKKEVLELVSKGNIVELQNIIKQDKRVLIALAERQDYRLRFCLSEEQKKDIELLKEIISRYPSIFLGLSTKLKGNKELEAIYEKNKKI